MRSKSQLDPKLTSLLGSVRHRVRRYIVWDSLLAIAAVILAGFWLGLALDFMPVQLGGTEMPRSARSVLLAVVGAVLLAVVVTLFIGRLIRPLPDESLALLLERHHPDFGGRLITAVQLVPQREPDASRAAVVSGDDAHSRSLLQTVHAQASSLVERADPNRIFRWQPLIGKAAIVLPLALAALGLAIVSPQTFTHAAGRLTLLTDDPWPRQADLEMVGIELPVISARDDREGETTLKPFQDRTIQVPLGSEGTLRIKAAAEDAVVPTVCTVYYQTDDGTRGQSNMRRVGRVTDGYQSFLLDGPPLTSLSDSMTFSVHGLDDRLEDYRIEAVQPPAVANMQVEVQYPAYLREPGVAGNDLVSEYRAGLRIREGSEVTLVANSSQPLADIDAYLTSDVGSGPAPSIVFSDDRKQARLRIPDFRSATTLSLVPQDQRGISAQAPFRYFLGVILDEPPEISLKLSGIGSAVTPVAKIPLSGSTRDDYGVKSFEIAVSAPANSDQSELLKLSPELDRDGQMQMEVDLRDLVADDVLPTIEPGQAIQIFAEASDGYDLDGSHVTRSEVFRLQVVTPEDLLALLERRELGLRTRLEQTISETRGLRDALDLLRRQVQDSGTTAESDQELTRQQQIWQLRLQQSALQSDKTSQELSGIAASLGDLLAEMVNNRVDSIDRRERIGAAVKEPIERVVADPLARLQEQLRLAQATVEDPEETSRRTSEAVALSEEVLLQLTAVLDKMLDLESYNEILDLVRGLIDDQEELLEETKQEQKNQVLELFK